MAYFFAILLPMILLCLTLFSMMLIIVTICTYLQELHELFRPLTDEEEDEVSFAFCGGNRYIHRLQSHTHTHSSQIYIFDD